MAVDAALNAARRLTFGPTPSVVADIKAMGVAAWVDSQLDPSSISDVETDVTTAAYPYAGLPPLLLTLEGDNIKATDQQRSVVAVRQLMSNRQLYEVMASFWSDHFSIYGNHQNASRFRAWDDRNVARKHAFATFPDLVNASAHSPSMLAFLDNDISSGKEPNENYARELMELHTLGVDGGYTEDDVHNAALALTGWSIDTNYWQFQFKPELHYVGKLQVMGWRHANRAGDGEAVGQSLLDYLSRHPATSRHLATKLCRRFVADNPPGALATRVAGTLRSTGFSIPAAIRTITGSHEFAAANGSKYRRPAEWAMASLRAIGAKPNLNPFPADRHPVVALLSSLGNQPFGWIPPNGFPDVAPDWLSTAQTMGRWNFAQTMSQNGIGDLTGYDPVALLGTPAPKTAGEMVDRLGKRILGQGPTADERAALFELIGRLDGASVTQAQIDSSLRPVIALLLSSPTMQVR